MLSICKASSSSRAGEPTQRQQSKLLVQQPSTVWSCMANPLSSVVPRVAMTSTTNATHAPMLRIAEPLT